MESVNFSDLIQSAGESGFAIVPKGWYDVVVDSAEAGETSGGKPRVRVKFRITSGPYAATTVKIRNDFNLTTDNPNALHIFFRQMEALGLTREWFAQLPAGPAAMQYVAQALLGRQARIQVNDSREYQGNKQNDMVDIQPPFGIAGAQATGQLAMPPAQQQFQQTAASPVQSPPAFGGYQPGPVTQQPMPQTPPMLQTPPMPQMQPPQQPPQFQPPQMPQQPFPVMPQAPQMAPPQQAPVQPSQSQMAPPPPPQLPQQAPMQAPSYQPPQPPTAPHPQGMPVPTPPQQVPPAPPQQQPPQQQPPQSGLPF